MSEQQLVEGVDYKILEDPDAFGGQRVEFFAHIEVPTCRRIATDRDKNGKVTAVSLVPAREPAIGLLIQSANVHGPPRGLGGPPPEVGIPRRQRHRRQPTQP